jgi:hypothetical protein
MGMQPNPAKLAELVRQKEYYMRTERFFLAAHAALLHGARSGDPPHEETLATDARRHAKAALAEFYKIMGGTRP